MRISGIAVILGAFVGLVGQTGITRAEDKVPQAAEACPACTAPSTQASATPVNTHCAVNPDDPADPTITVQYKGRTIGFCCESCIEEFNRDPEKYIAKMK